MRRFGSASLHSNAAVDKQLPVSLVLGFLEALIGAVKPVAVTATGGCFLYLCTREVARAQVQVHLHDKQAPQTLSTGEDKQAFGVAAATVLSEGLKHSAASLGAGNAAIGTGVKEGAASLGTGVKEGAASLGTGMKEGAAALSIGFAAGCGFIALAAYRSRS